LAPRLEIFVSVIVDRSGGDTAAQDDLGGVHIDRGVAGVAAGLDIEDALMRIPQSR
jgi:hypothetical protein